MFQLLISHQQSWNCVLHSYPTTSIRSTFYYTNQKFNFKANRLATVNNVSQNSKNLIRDNSLTDAPLLSKLKWCNTVGFRQVVLKYLQNINHFHKERRQKVHPAYLDYLQFIAGRKLLICYYDNFKLGQEEGVRRRGKVVLFINREYERERE